MTTTRGVAIKPLPGAEREAVAIADLLNTNAITGDGVVGLSRSFVSAGVPTVLVSLWAVPDAPTAELMTAFYRQRGLTGDNAQALRQAMLQTMETHPEPRNWAAFTLIGESEKVGLGIASLKNAKSRQRDGEARALCVA